MFYYKTLLTENKTTPAQYIRLGGKLHPATAIPAFKCASCLVFFSLKLCLRVHVTWQQLFLTHSSFNRHGLKRFLLATLLNPVQG